MNLSYWEKEEWFTNIDFTIVGSGIVGLNTALTIASKYPKEVYRINIGLGKGYKATGDKKKAIKHWEIALKNMPKTIDYQYYLPRLEKELKELKASNE